MPSLRLFYNYGLFYSSHLHFKFLELFPVSLSFHAFCIEKSINKQLIYFSMFTQTDNIIQIYIKFRLETN